MFSRGEQNEAVRRSYSGGIERGKGESRAGIRGFEGEKPLSLTEDGNEKDRKAHTDLLANADISRFDRSKRKKKRGNKSGQNAKANGEQPRKDTNAQ